MVIKHCPPPPQKISKLENKFDEIKKKIFKKDRTSLSYRTNCSSLINTCVLGRPQRRHMVREVYEEKLVKNFPAQ